jgi:hypothetical protein
MLLIDPLGDPSGEPLGGQKDDLRASAERSIGRVGLIALECIEFALGRSAAASASFEEHADDDSDEHGVSDVAPLVDGSGSSASGATVSANGCVALFVLGLLALVDAVVGALGSSASGPSLGWAAHVP